jgi:microcystin-dependent protein
MPMFTTTSAALTIPAGIILPYGGATSPSGYFMCIGGSLSTSTYADLFAAIGYAWGGTGTVFHLPDLRGRFLRGVDGGASRDPDAATRTFGVSGGNTGDNVGSIQGATFGEHTHTQAAHTHTQNAHGHAVKYCNSGAGSPEIGGTGDTSDTGTNANANVATAAFAINVTATNQNTTATNNDTGGNETRPLNANVNYIIKY